MTRAKRTGRFKMTPEPVYGRGFFKSQRYLRACEMMGVHPFRNPSYKDELKKAGLWWKPRSEADKR